MIMKTIIPESLEECFSIKCEDCSLGKGNILSRKCEKIRGDIIQYYKNNESCCNSFLRR